MDSITHIVLGACAGQLIAGKQLGRKALLFGAAAQSLPDIDFLRSFFLSTSADLLSHRGITHSWFFVVLATAFLAWASMKLFPKTTMTGRRWIILWGIEMAIHLLIDACNVYGTAWWLPFSSERISFNLLYVADPLFTIPPLVAAVLLVWRRTPERNKARWARNALLICTAYIALCVRHKHVVDVAVKTAAKERGIVAKRFFSTPTPFNNLLFYTLLETDSGYYVNHRSSLDFDTVDPFYFFPKNESLMKRVNNRKDARNLRVFSQGWYTMENKSDTLIFNDLRFGQMQGWANSEAGFTFYFYLDRPGANELVVQRGRFKNWDGEAAGYFIRRMFGMK